MSSRLNDKIKPSKEDDKEGVLYEKVQQAIGSGITREDFFDFLLLRAFLKDDTLTISPDEAPFDPKTARESYDKLVRKIISVTGPIEGLKLKQESEA